MVYKVGRANVKDSNNHQTSIPKSIPQNIETQWNYLRFSNKKQTKSAHGAANRQKDALDPSAGGAICRQGVRRL